MALLAYPTTFPNEAVAPFAALLRGKPVDWPELGLSWWNLEGWALSVGLGAPQPHAFSALGNVDAEQLAQAFEAADLRNPQALNALGIGWPVLLAIARYIVANGLPGLGITIPDSIKAIIDAILSRIGR